MSTYYGKGTDDLSFTPLTVEEERELFSKYYAGDLVSRDKIIQTHLKYVAKLSLQVAKHAIPEDEAISAGNAGLMQALDLRKFDPTKGARFSTYLRLFVVGKVREQLRFVIEASNRAPLGADEPETLPPEVIVTGVLADGNRPQSPSVFVDSEAENSQFNLERREALEKAMTSLSEIEQAAVRAVFFDGKTCVDVAAKLGVTRQAAQQARVRAMKKLRAVLSETYSELK